MLIFKLFGDSKPFISDCNDTENAQNNTWNEDGQKKNQDNSFLSFDGKF